MVQPMSEPGELVVASRKAYRTRFGDTDWEQHFVMWSVYSEQESIQCWRNGEFGDGSIGSSTAKSAQNYARISE